MRTPDAQPQRERETPEPQERTRPVPWFVLVSTALLLTFGGVYIATSAISGSPADGDGRTIGELQGAAPAASSAAADGAAIFASRCSACHQASGAGLPGVFPPLAGSEWVAGDEGTLAALVLHGIDGPLTVKGATYKGAMPAFREQLQDAEIAAVLTHVRSQWGNHAPAIAAATVAAARKDTGNRSGPFKGDSELGLPK